MNGPRRHSSRVSRPPRGVYCASHALVKTLTSQDIGIAANALCMRGGKNIDLETEDEISVLMDHAIYDVVRDGRNAVDRLLEERPPPEGSMELRLLRSLQKAHYKIFEVQTPIPGFGVRGLEGPARTPILIVDMGFQFDGRSWIRATSGHRKGTPGPGRRTWHGSP